MSGPFNDDLLSAYFDGEATPEECAEIERAVASSPERRQELDDFARLSKLVRGLPAQQPPAEFRAAVMQEAERVSLLGTAAEGIERGGASSNRRSAWVRRVSVVASTAAALVVMAWLLGDREGRNPTETALREPDAHFETGGEESLAARMRENVAGAEVAVSDAVRDAPAFGLELKRSEPPTADRSVALRGTMAPAAESVNGILPEEALRQAFSRTSGLAVNSLEAESLNFRFEKTQLSDAEVGEVVEALERTGDEIAVVQLTVIDRQAGLESLQVLLSRNQIVFEEEESRSNGAERRSAGEQLVAVYVEASSEQLSSALRELTNEGPFRELVVDRTIELASVDNDALGRVQDGAEADARRKADVATTPSIAGKAGTALEREKGTKLAIPQEPAKDKASAASASPAAPPAPAPAKGGNREKDQNQEVAELQNLRPAQQSRQRTIELPARLLKQTPEAKTIADALGVTKKGSQAADETQSSPAAAAGAAEPLQKREAAQPRSLQVLFVLVSKSPGDEKPADAARPAPKAKPVKPAAKANQGAA